MAMTDKREEAEDLYIKQSISCPEIAKRLDIDSGTVYRWKADAAKKGEAFNWDTRRRAYHLSPREIKAIYGQTIKNWVLQISSNPDLIGKSADAICKHVSVMEKLDKTGQYLNVALDLMKVLNEWLTVNQPEIKEKIEPYWDQIFEALQSYYKEKEIF